MATIGQRLAKIHPQKEARETAITVAQGIFKSFHETLEQYLSDNPTSGIVQIKVSALSFVEADFMEDQGNAQNVLAVLQFLATKLGQKEDIFIMITAEEDFVVFFEVQPIILIEADVHPHRHLN